MRTLTRPGRGATALLLTLALGLAACGSSRPGPGPDTTGPVEPVADVQSTPENLFAEVLRLRQDGHPEQAARYFISQELSPDQINHLTQVDATMLCTSKSAKCTFEYQEYLSDRMDKDCPGVTPEQVRKVGTVPSDSRGYAARAVRGVPTCALYMDQIGGAWWIPRG